jgi:hypothetical protein
MKTVLCFLLSALAAAAVRAEVGPAAPTVNPGTGRAGVSPGTGNSANLFSLVGADYKKPQELPDSFFNPFKIDTAFESALQKKAEPVTNEAVTDALDRHGVSGITYASEPGQNRVLIGDQVFGVGDELTFPDMEKGGSQPLMTGASITLREINPGYLSFDVTPEGEAAHRLSFSLRNFWKP